MEAYYWEPWIGCSAISQGCNHCKFKECTNENNRCVKFNKSKFYLPTSKTRVYNLGTDKKETEYKIPSKSIIFTCTKSDFFHVDADLYRKRAWRQILERPDCLFIITTKRVDRIIDCLPDSWTEKGWNNVLLKVSAENQVTADYRFSKLIKLPFTYKGIELAPLLSSIDIAKYLATGQIMTVNVMGESHKGRDVIACNMDWVYNIKEQCEIYGIDFEFTKTGTHLFSDGRLNVIKGRDEYTIAEFKGLNTSSNDIQWEATVEDIQMAERIMLAKKVYELAQSMGITS